MAFPFTNLSLRTCKALGERLLTPFGWGYPIDSGSWTTIVPAAYMHVLDFNFCFLFGPNQNNKRNYLGYRRLL